MKAYLVVDYDEHGYAAKRMYLDRPEADAFVQAYNATGGYLEVEEIGVGTPDVEYDGPIWFGEWSTRRKQVGEKQLIVVTDGFTMVVPSAVPSGPYRYPEMFTPTGPSWLATSIEYEEPPVWIDNFYYRQTWHTGDYPNLAVVTRDEDEVSVRGTTKVLVELLLRDMAHQVKAERR